VNIIFRLADYYFDSAMSYLKIRKADLHSSVKVDVPDVEACPALFACLSGDILTDICTL